MKKSTEKYREFNREIGKRIKKTRNLKGMSQMELAERLNVSYQQVQKYEYGTSFVTVSRLRQISDVLEMPISAFIGESGGKDIYSLNEREIELIALFREFVTLKGKNDVLRMVEKILMLATK